MTPIKIIRPFENCTYDKIGPERLGRLRGLGFMRIVVHRGVEAVLSNTIYIFCTLTKPKDPKKWHLDIDFRPDAAQCEVCIPKRGVAFNTDICLPNGRPFGKYSSADNVLWLPDITHRDSMDLLDAVIKVLEEEKHK